MPVAAGIALSGLLGAGAAATEGSPAIAAAVAILIIATVTFVLAPEFLLVGLIVTAPIGLEQVTGGERSLLPSFGGFAVSSIRLGILILVGLALLAVRGMPRRFAFFEHLYLAAVVILLASLVISPDFFAGLRFTAKVAALLVAWLAFESVVRRFGEATVWRIVLWTLAVTLAVDYAIYLTGFGGIQGDVSRFSGLAGGPSSSALSVAILALGALYVWFADGNRYALALYVGTWPLVFLSVTRIAIIAFIISSGLLSILMGRWRQAAVITLIFGIVAFSYAPLRDRMVYGRGSSTSWQSIFQNIRTNGVNGLNTEGRIQLWHPLWSDFRSHPILGGGAGSSEHVLTTFTGNPNNQQAHSDYLAVLVNGGVVVFGLWLVGLAGLAKRFSRRMVSAAPAAAGLVLFLLAGITDNAVEMYAPVGIPLALYVAIAFARRGEEPEGDEGAEREPIPGGGWPRRHAPTAGARRPRPGHADPHAL
jgi:O-antigen ligase